MSEFAGDDLDRHLDRAAAVGLPLDAYCGHAGVVAASGREQLRRTVQLRAAEASAFWCLRKWGTSIGCGTGLLLELGRFHSIRKVG